MRLQAVESTSAVVTITFEEDLCDEATIQSTKDLASENLTFNVVSNPSGETEKTFLMTVTHTVVDKYG